MNEAFFSRVRALYGGKLNEVQVADLMALIEATVTMPVAQRAYILATAHHETGAFKYMREIWGPTPAQSRYEGRKDLGNTVKGDGKKFMGRGFIQITGRANYADWSQRLGVDLIAKPELAEGKEVATRIIVDGMRLGTFTGKKLSDYIGPDGADYKGARRIVNGTDKADLIAGYAATFEAALRAGIDAETAVTASVGTSSPLSFIAKILRAIFGEKK